ncbi:MAG: thiamine pyrophosphate-dependent enzyme [Hyphomicrobiales bacterium]
MAERSFKKEVQKLRLGEGETFTGEGILAVTKALLQSGVGYVGGYQGAPISHLMDVLADAQDILGELGVHFEASASEAAAAAMLATSVHYPIRGAATWKSTVGTNVASDALANLASTGVVGGALIITGEDYGEGSSIMQERSHAFAMKSQVWLLDPRPNAESIVKAVEDGFALSEASNTPVMLELRIRACHVHGSFVAKDNRRPSLSLAEARSNPRKQPGRVVLPPDSYAHEREKLEQRWPAAVEFIKKHKLNELFAGDVKDVGIILQGGMYNAVIAALRKLGLADVYGETRIPLYVMNVTYPLIDDEVIKFCKAKKAVLMVEEGQPDYLEQAVHAILRKAKVSTPLHGKDMLPRFGEYVPKVVIEGFSKFLKQHAPKALTKTKAPPRGLSKKLREQLEGAAPPRPAGFCTGCPERPIFSALTLVQNELGEHQVSGDIGCHLFSSLPPFNIGTSTMGYGLGPASASGLNTGEGKRQISIMGDGGFWHNGLTSGVGNAVFNNSDDVIVLIDNYYAAATGGQDILSSRAKNVSKSTRHPIEKAVRGVGVNWVRLIDDTYDVEAMRRVLRAALTTQTKGPKVVIASSECMLNRQRREKPQKQKLIANGKRAEVERFGVDADICTGDHACIRISGCPSLSLKDNPDPLRDDPIAHVDETCVACGHCGEVADAAVLCPSFYSTSIVKNPNMLDRVLSNIRHWTISKLQDRYARRWLSSEEAR